MRQPLVAGNWKMNGSGATVTSLLDGIKEGMAQVSRAEVAVCPPFVYLRDVQQQLKGSEIRWGAQDLSVHDSGAYTGEIAGPMLADLECSYVIVGHSERRAYHQESNELVAEKYEAALRAGLTPILCVGETLEQREQGVTNDIVAAQLNAAIARCGVDAIGSGVIAYEPVWAIGTGKTATPEQAQEVHAFIRGLIAGQNGAIAEQVRILYGGSMKPGNAEELIAKPDIDGGLIGGAALKAEDFLAICKAAN